MDASRGDACGSVERPGGRVWYERRGEVGPRVLLLQGVGVTASGWRPQVDLLERDHRTCAIDNRGIGRSVPFEGEIEIEAMAGDALAVLDALGWPSAHVVGHSMGGVIAQALALRAPSRVRSLALLCTFARGKDGGRLDLGTLWMGIRTNVGTRRMRRRAFLEILYPRAYLASRDLDALAASLAPVVGRDLADSPPIVMKQVRALGAHDASARLGDLAKVPALVMSGAHDPIALPRFGREIAGRIAGARFHLAEDAAHGLPLQEPALVDRMLRELWSGVAGEG